MATRQDNKPYEYYAFISYKREDEKWAKWLQHKLEYYKLPSSVRKDNPDLPGKIRPVFKDTTDLEPGVLAQKIQDALNSSKFLIVICSPRSANSVWVSKEVQSFIDSGRADHIIPFIIGGTPNALNPKEECYPEGLRQLAGEKELLGANINEMGRDAAAIKVVARMFNLRFDSLWQRFERNRKKRIVYLVAITVLSVLAAFCIGYLYIDRNLAYDNLSKANIEITRERNNAEKLNQQLTIANDSVMVVSKRISEKNDSLSLYNQRLLEANYEITVQQIELNSTNKNLRTQYSILSSNSILDLIQNNRLTEAKKALYNLLKNGYEVIPHIERAMRELYYYANKADGIVIDNIKWDNNLSSVVGSDNGNVYFTNSDGIIAFDIFKKTIKSLDRNNISTKKIHEYNIPQNVYVEYANDTTFLVRRIDNNALILNVISKTPIKLLPNYIVSELNDEINVVPYLPHLKTKKWKPSFPKFSWDVATNMIVAYNDSIVSFYDLENNIEKSHELHQSDGLGFSLPGRLDKCTSKFVHVTTDSIIQIFEPEGLLLQTKLSNQIKNAILGGNDYSKIFIVYRDNSSELLGYTHETPKLISLYKSIPLFDYGYIVTGSFINDTYFYVSGGRGDVQIYRIPELSNMNGEISGFLSGSGKSVAQFINGNWCSVDIEKKEGVRLGGESLYDFVAYSGNDSIIIFREELPYRSEMGNDITQIRYVNIPTRENVELSGTTMEEHMQKVAVSKNGNLIVCNRINDNNNFITLLNTKSKTVSSTSIETSPSTLFYDNSDKYIYVICGNDLLHIKIEDDKIGKIRTADISNHGYIIGGICNPLNDEEVIVWTYEGEVQFWDRATKVTKRIQPWKQNCLIFDMSISQDGKYLLVTYYHDGVGLSNYNLNYREKELVIYDVKSGEVIFNVPTNYMLNSFSNDGGRIISNHRQGTHWTIDFPTTDNLVKWILSEK